jgi:hypothetical protein
MILCECGEIIDGCTFKDYIKTAANPSTPTIGHRKCGLIFNFIEGDLPKRYSSRVELKEIARKFAERKGFEQRMLEVFLIEVDRLKSCGKFSDMDILISALKIILERASAEHSRIDRR